MILKRYLFKEIIKNQIIVLVVLLVVFLSQSVIRLVTRAASGKIPADIVLNLAAYSVPEIFMIMLPLTLFVAILMSMGRICSDSEMVVMRSVGFSPANVMSVTLFIALLTAVVTAVNSIYLVPVANQKIEDLKVGARNNPQYIPLESERFLEFGEYNIYIRQYEESNGRKNIQQVYVMTYPFYPAASTVTVADEGHLLNDEHGVQWLYLNNGQRYEGPVADGTFRVGRFGEFRAPLAASTEEQDQKDIDIDCTDTWTLLHSDEVKARIEAQWRIAPVLALFVLAMTAVPLSMVNPRQGRFARLMPAIMIYTAYYVLLLSVRNMAVSGRLPVGIGLYIVPVFFLLFVVIPLNMPRELLKLLKKGGGSSK